MLVQNGAYKEYIKLDKRYGINNDGRPDSFHEILRLFIIDSENQYKYFDTITWRYILVYIDQITAKLNKYTIGNDFNADYPEFIKVLKEIISEVQSEDIKYSILIDRLVKESQSAVISFRGYSTLYKDLVDNGEITRANFEKYIDNAVLSSMGQSIAMYVYSMTSKIKMLTNYDMNDVINDSNIAWMLLLDIIPALDNIKDTKYIKDIHNFALKLSKNISDETFIDLESYEKWYENEYDDEPYNPYNEDVYDDWLAYHKGFEEAEAEDLDVDVNTSLEELKNSLHEMKATLSKLELDNKLDKMADRINKLEVKILSLDNLNSIHNQSSETTSPDSEEDDDYDEYWDDTSENYDEYYEYDKDDDEDDDDEISEGTQYITDLSDAKIILDSINNLDRNPIKISIDGEISSSDYTYVTPIENIHIEYYRTIVDMMFDMCVKIFNTYLEFRNDVHKNLKYKLSVDELADFDKGLQYFMTDDPRLNECGNETVQSALNYVTKLTYVRDAHEKYKSNIKFIKGCITVLSSLEKR